MTTTTEVAIQAAVRRRKAPFSHVLREKLLAAIYPAVGIGIALGLWWWYSSGHPLTAPSPQAVFDDIKNNLFSSSYLAQHGVAGGKGYWFDLAYTVKNVLIGVGFGTILGVGIGLLSIPYRVIGDVANPPALLFGSAPIFISAPFFLIWFGIVPIAQILMVAFYTTLLMYIFSRRATENVAVDYVESAWTLGAKRKDVFWSIYAPATVPELIGGFRIALAGAWGLEAIAELLGAQQGTGFLIFFFTQTYSIQKIMAIVIVLGLTAILFDRLTVIVARGIVRWTDTGRTI